MKKITNSRPADHAELIALQDYLIIDDYSTGELIHSFGGYQLV